MFSPHISFLVFLLFIPFVLCDEVRTAQELINIFNSAAGAPVTKNIVLKNHIDFSETNFKKPLGLSSSGSCVEYSGTFQGNGFSIQGLVMYKTTGRLFKAGLFCTLKNAVVENLVIDSSCSFTGWFAGALSPIVSGSVNITHVTNKANVSGDELSGGFFGTVQSLENAEVFLDECKNEGNVSSINCLNVGGFIGQFYDNNNINITFSRCSNSGEITGYSSVGGFIGYMTGNKNMSAVIFESSNNGYVNGTREIGGFIGEIHDSNNISLVISESSNNGFTNGTREIGGFVGYILSNQNMELSFSDCSNSGETNGTSQSGGFIGETSLNPSIKVSFSECLNDALISGSKEIGAFIGDFSSNRNGELTISHCTNDGIISGGNCVGGFLGSTDGSEMKVILSNCVNNGIINGKTEGAGLIGRTGSSPDSSFTISNCANNGNVIGDRLIGGLIGSISVYSQWLCPSIAIINSANKGDILANRDCASGLFYVDTCFSIDITVINCMNKGRIQATEDANGIGNNMRKAKNVVSIGEIDCSSRYSTFWNSSTEADSLYGLRNKCENCPEKTSLFELNTNTGFYEVANGEHVNDLLNDEAVNKQYGSVWTKELDLVDKVNLTIHVSSQTLDEDLLAESGTPLGKVKGLEQFFEKQYGVVKTGQETVVYEPTYLVSRNMSLTIINKYCVSVGSPYNGDVCVFPGQTVGDMLKDLDYEGYHFIVLDRKTQTVLDAKTALKDGDKIALCHSVVIYNLGSHKDFIVEHDDTLSSNSSLKEYADGYHLGEYQNVNTSDIQLDHKVKRKMELVLCYLVRATGAVNETVLVEAGRELGSTNLSIYFDPAYYYEAHDGKIPPTYYYPSTIISGDITVYITDQCVNFAQHRCENSGDMCTWDSKQQLCRRTGSNETTKNNLPIIIGVCVCGGAVIIIAVVVIVVVVVLTKRKKKRKGMNKIELYNTGMFKTMSDTRTAVAVKMDGKDTVLQLLEEVGHGSYATVWKAVDGESKKEYAVKMIDGRKSTGATEAQKEAMMMEQLDTQFVVAVFGCGFTQNTMAIAMEFFPLGSLQNVLQQDKLPSNARVPMLLDIAKAMAYLHTNGIIHRDLKPGNVLVCSTDPNVHPMSKFVSFFQQQESE